jgi:hypothetical protein
MARYVRGRAKIALAAQSPDAAAAGTLSRSEGARWRARDAPLVAHCHLGLGRLSIRTGDREEALRHLAVATSMCREMDMRFWLEQAEGDAKGLV